MDIFIQIVHLVSAIVVVGSIGILVALEDSPDTVQDHLRGLGRYTTVLGAGLSGAYALSDQQPHWVTAVLMTGLAFQTATVARDRHMAALAFEKVPA